jgi:hypothetical protein
MKTTSIIAMALLGMFTTFTASAQNNVGIGTASPDASAALEIESTTQGFLPPRLSSTQRDAIAAPVAVGLIVWCTNCGTNGEVQVYNGSAWTNMVGAAAALSLQERLDGGETPFSIYNTLVTGGSTSSSAALDSLYGKTYKGGLIAYLNTTTGTGLIAAATDQSTGIQWTTSTHHNTLIGSTAQSDTDGSANTTAIINQTGAAAVNTYAAGLCQIYTGGGHTDWYLPSLNELDALFTNLHLKGLGGFDNEGYWSSTEQYGDKAKSVGFDSATFGSNGYKKSNSSRNVRAVRAF